MLCEQAHCYQVNFFCLSIQLFFQNNQGGEETTVVDYIGFIGSPLDTTNMDDFKRVRFHDSKPINHVRINYEVAFSHFGSRVWLCMVIHFLCLLTLN